MVQAIDNNQGVFRSLDKWTVFIYVALLVFGWISVCGASYTYGSTDIFSMGSRSGMQIVWIGTSLALGFVILMTDSRMYDTFAYVIYGVLLLLLFVTIFNPHEIVACPWTAAIAAGRVCQVRHGARGVQAHEQLWL